MFARSPDTRHNRRMAHAMIGIGSNVGDRAAHIEIARQGLARLPRTELLAFSRVYATAPVSHVPQGEFLNAAALLETALDPHDLLTKLLEIERQTGRQPPGHRIKWGPRTLDMDVLLYDDRVIDTGDLRVPHPAMHERWFVLRPLADVAPDAVHPVLKKTVRELLEKVEAPE
ncbi:MAG: 2-amino-4-hydroxy-6-hydroxymethyldihydropteridine diphosphokinase [Phycisphaeraceae bacterium]|nr:2-amino-4-hydroxy-6-hydroxymethyldihydropteridine diphosphokinase [Phycisphaeraceae bacterium]